MDCKYITAGMMLLYFKLLGLAPFSIRRSTELKQSNGNTSQDYESIILSSSYFGLVYNICLVIIYTIMISLAIPAAYNDDYLNKSTLTTTIEYTTFIYGNTVLIFIWLIFGFRQKTAAKLLTQLLRMDGTTDNSMSGFILLVFFIHIGVWVGLIVPNSLAFEHSILHSFVTAVPSNTISWFFAQYSFTVKLIENRFKAVNRALLDHALIPSLPEATSEHTARCAAKNHSTKPKIAILRQAYISLFDVSSKISDYNSVPILFSIGYMCILILYNAYYTVVPYVIMMERPSSMILADSLLWLIGHILPIIILASTVTNVLRESTKTAHIIWELEATSKSRQDDIELELFSLELLHRKVEFSACDLFPLDLTIVYSIFSMVITYLVILIQFQMGNAMHSEGDGTHNITNAT